MTNTSFSPNGLNIPKNEEAILKHWDAIDAFGTQVELSKENPNFVFYDGPPFATGLPHFGNILAGYVKDIVTRWACQEGHSVPRVFGWDCHGLPIENEINKQLNVKSPSHVKEEIGIAKYNEECRSIVQRYAGQWETIIHRLGRWIDFENDFKTMDCTSMETVWWVFKKLFEKGLIYRGYKVMPYSTGLNTPLSNFEANLNYQDAKDPAIVVKFQLNKEWALSQTKLKEKRLSQYVSSLDGDVFFLAWTTTPWSLPANLGLCVNPKFKYALVKNNEKSEYYILLESKLKSLKKNEKGERCSYEKMDLSYETSFTGEELVEHRHHSLFETKNYDTKTNLFVVMGGLFVTSESGTGVVHCAPGFGEDDMTTALQNGVISKDEAVLCPVDEMGCLTSTDIMDDLGIVGIHIKTADDKIIEALKKSGLLISKSTITHSYPFCERSKTPLIYKAVPCWFLSVTTIKKQMMENNMKTYWVPETVKLKRFHNWLDNARDWAISRTRYWGTPLPVWTNDDFTVMKVIGSRAELLKLANLEGQNLDDIHMHNIDHITINYQGQTLKRIPDVFDCWFESGSMPYSERHFPFSKIDFDFSNPTDIDEKLLEEEVSKFLPANFIAEGIDQTRGWFYTLLVLSTGLFNRPPFSKLIVHGLVLARDGKKMSKHLKNFSDPCEVVNETGADPLRLYLINSPVVKGEFLRFKNESVKDEGRKLLHPMFNCFNHLRTYYNLKTNDFLNELFVDYSANGQLDQIVKRIDDNVLDKWLISAFNSLLTSVKKEMDALFLYNIVSLFQSFANDFCNTYVRNSRDRLAGKLGEESQIKSQACMVLVLTELSILLGSFCPFFSDSLFLSLKDLSGNTMHNYYAKNFISKQTDENTISKIGQSVHFQRIPTQKGYHKVEIEEVFLSMKHIVELGRKIREKVKINLKQKLNKIQVYCSNDNTYKLLKDDKNGILELIKRELNVGYVIINERAGSGLKVSAIPIIREIGVEFLKKTKVVLTKLKTFVFKQGGDLNKITGQELGIEGGDMTLERNKHFSLKLELSEETGAMNWEADEEFLTVLDTEINEELKVEGFTREVISFLQRQKKRGKLSMEDKSYAKLEGVVLESGEPVLFNEKLVNTIEERTYLKVLKSGNPMKEGLKEVSIEKLKLPEVEINSVLYVETK